jgi:hypothetical protein
MAGSIVSVKSFTYRDQTGEEWSNRYHFQGDPPSTPSDWRDLCDDFAALEAAVLTTQSNIIRFLCYAADGDPTVYSYDLAAFGGVVPGTWALGAGSQGWVSGDVAYLIRWNTGRLSTKGKPVYLFKYYHGGASSDSDRDKPPASLETAMGTFGNTVRSASGNWPGLADKNGDEPVGYLAETYLTTRTLKRRGRRPT